MAQLTIEARVAALESDMAKLKAPPKREIRKKDWRRTIGMFAGDAVMKRIFDTALKYREADRERARRRNAKRRRANK